MVEAGILGAEERIELIEGQMVPMAPIGSEHAGRVIGLTQLLVTATAGRALVSTQNPVRLSGITEPEPDFAILKLRQGTYTDRHPNAEDILLLIEVADSSLVYDMTVKGDCTRDTPCQSFGSLTSDGARLPCTANLNTAPTRTHPWPRGRTC